MQQCSARRGNIRGGIFSLSHKNRKLRMKCKIWMLAAATLLAAVGIGRARRRV